MTQISFSLSASADEHLFVVTCHGSSRSGRRETACAGTIMRMGDDLFVAELHGEGDAAIPIAGPFHSVDAAQRAVERHYEDLHGGHVHRAHVAHDRHHATPHRKAS